MGADAPHQTAHRIRRQVFGQEAHDAVSKTLATTDGRPCEDSADDGSFLGIDGDAGSVGVFAVAVEQSHGAQSVLFVLPCKRHCAKCLTCK